MNSAEKTDLIERPAPAPLPAGTTAESLLQSAVLWLDAGRGVELVDGRVAAWRDQSGRHNDATMPEPARRPTLLDFPDGTHSLNFNDRQSLATTKELRCLTMTVFAVGRSSESERHSGIILGPEGGNKMNELSWEGPHWASLLGPDYAEPEVRARLGDNAETHVLAARYDGQFVTLWRNDQGTANLKAKKSKYGYLFNSIGSHFSERLLNGEIGAIVVFDRVLDDSELLAVSRYLQKAYRIGEP